MECRSVIERSLETLVSHELSLGLLRSSSNGRFLTSLPPLSVSQSSFCCKSSGSLVSIVPRPVLTCSTVCHSNRAGHETFVNLSSPPTPRTYIRLRFSPLFHSQSSGHTLAYLFALLALNPEAQSRLHDHVSAVLPDRRKPVYEDFQRLNLVLGALYETMRFVFFPLSVSRSLPSPPS